MLSNPVADLLSTAVAVATESVDALVTSEQNCENYRVKNASLEKQVSELQVANAELTKKAERAPQVEIIKVASVHEANLLTQFLADRGIISRDAEELTKTAGTLQTLPEAALLLMRKTANLVAPLAPSLGSSLKRQEHKDRDTAPLTKVAGANGQRGRRENVFIEPDW